MAGDRLGKQDVAGFVKSRPSGLLFYCSIHAKRDSGSNSSWGECGYLAAAGMTLPLLSWQKADKHEHRYIWKYNYTEHWQECSCGKIIDRANHNFTENTQYLETAATCTNKAKCDVCGAEYGNPDPTNHTGTGSWTKTATHHEQKWSCCETVVVGPHVLENDVCTECGYRHKYTPTVQKPEITVIGSGKFDLSSDGKTATITADEEYELVSITVNGKEVANTDKLTGLKTGDKVVVTFQKKPVDTKIIAEKVSKMKLTARFAKTAKKNINITVKTDKETDNIIKELEDLGYTVKYKYYRSTKKSSKYSAKLEKDHSINSYINTTGKKGTRYYYKVKVMVYDADGNLVASSKLKQCRYAARVWSK